MKRVINILAIAIVILAITCGCKQKKVKVTTNEETTEKLGVDPAKFVSTINNKPTALYTLKSADGMVAGITNFGGRIVTLLVPDKDGNMTDVVLGYDSIAQYADTVNNSSDFGATIGRYANRIKDGKISIDGVTYQLPRNNYGHCLHGGFDGWQYKVFDAEQPNDSTLNLTYVSPDGENNFPGTVTAKVTFTALKGNKLDIKYSATTDKPTVINMTNHSYFNLNGDPDKNVENCLLNINADNFTPTDSTFMTTGEIRPVEGTPMDFRDGAKAIGANVNNFDYEPIKFGKGFDHNWVLNTYKDGKGDISQRAAYVVSPETGIVLSVYTDEPGIQVYTGNFLDGTRTGKYGKTYQKHAAICLETQKYPDTPNKPDWPTARLNPGQTYNSHTIFEFSVVDK